MIGMTLIIVSVLVIGIWTFVELKKLKHQLVAMFFIALILMTYISFSLVTQDYDLNYKSVDGLMEAGKIYLSWLGGIGGNFKTITSNAIKMDWSVNESTG